jgi:hypothetical protein
MTPPQLQQVLDKTEAFMAEYPTLSQYGKSSSYAVGSYDKVSYTVLRNSTSNNGQARTNLRGFMTPFRTKKELEAVEMPG